MRAHLVAMLLAGGGCGGTLTYRGTGGAGASGPDFNGGFDRRPMPTYALADGGTAYQWPTTMPDGWTAEAGTIWNRGIHDMYGEGYDAGPPLQCHGADGGDFNCPGTGDAPSGSALVGAVCDGTNGGCSGVNVVSSPLFPVVGGQAHLLSLVAKMRQDFWGQEVAPPGVSVEVAWLSSAGGGLGVSVVPVTAVGLDWTESTAQVMAPPGATQARVTVKVSRLPRKIWIDRLALDPI